MKRKIDPQILVNEFLDAYDHHDDSNHGACSFDVLGLRDGACPVRQVVSVRTIVILRHRREARGNRETSGLRPDSRFARRREMLC